MSLKLKLSRVFLDLVISKNVLIFEIMTKIAKNLNLGYAKNLNLCRPKGHI